MKVKDLLKIISDVKLYIEFKDKQSYASYGFYTKSDLIYNDKFNNYKIDNITSQYIDKKRVIVVFIK